MPGLLARDLSGITVAWSPDLGLPVEPEVLAALAPAREVLTGLGARVVDAAPDLSGADEAFRTLRAFRFATFSRDCWTPGAAAWSALTCAGTSSAAWNSAWPT